MAEEDLEPPDAVLVDELEQQGELDREAITGLEQQAQVDHEIIAALLEQGALARTEIANLHEALVTARRIGAAMGILMSSRGLTQEAAFDALRDRSQHSHRKLREIADEVLCTGAVGTD
jgi:hypothetical protein